VSGVIAGVLSVSDSASGSPQIIPLSGTGTVTNPISFSPPNLNFTNQPVGSTSASQTLALTNNGASAITITGVSASGDYGEKDTCNGKSIAGSGGTCTIKVTFTPNAAGNIAGELTVKDTAATSPQLVNLTGTGVNALTVSPASLSFSGQVGAVSVAQNATLANIPEQPSASRKLQ